MGTVEAIGKRGCACNLGGADGAGDLNPERRREGARLCERSAEDEQLPKVLEESSRPRKKPDRGATGSGFHRLDDSRGPG